jgi:hypothetical protein
MDAEKKLDTIEEEMKLLKGELKQSLTSVRDYLLNMELPSSEFSTILAALGNEGEGSQKITIQGNIANSGGQSSEELTDGVEEITEEEVPEPEDELSLEPNDILSPEALQGSHNEQSDESDYNPDIPEYEEPVALVDPEETGEPAVPVEPDYDDTGNELDDLGETDDNDEFYKPVRRQAKPSLEEDPSMGYENVNNESQASTPKVNLLANLINWVAKAKKEIGDEQLPTFLEVYGVSGHLSPELKEAILQLCDITTEQPEATSRADVWSQSMLSLHGILTGGDAPLYPFKSTALSAEDEETAGEEEIIEVDKPKEQPIKLKLVLPDGNGESREFCVDLAPSMEGD